MDDGDITRTRFAMRRGDDHSMVVDSPPAPARATPLAETLAKIASERVDLRHPERTVETLSSMLRRLLALAERREGPEGSQANAVLLSRQGAKRDRLSKPRPIPPFEQDISPFHRPILKDSKAGAVRPQAPAPKPVGRPSAYARRPLQPPRLRIVSTPASPLPDGRERAFRDYAAKRWFDLILACGALFALAPVLALIWLAVRITSPGPGLYWSQRVGRHRRMFRMPKFRTMATNTPLQPREEINNPARYITPLGKILRRLSLDELPQLACILRGDMSFIGPRPLLPGDPALFARAFYPAVFHMRPGLSGLAQIRGRNLVSPRCKARLDAYYARIVSWRIDAAIFVRTLGVLASGKGFI